MFCKIWNIWDPEHYKPIEIIAEEVDDDIRPENKKIISAFSGGLDAAYTAYKYKNKLAGRNNGDLECSVMIHGADIPLNAKEDFEIAFSKAKTMTDDLGIKLIPVETNFRKVVTTNWEHCFGTLMVATLNFFSKYFSIGVASDASITTYKTPWGMNPITDPFLSNSTFKFIADGYEHSRTQRAALIKDWKVGIDNLRVCWKNKDKSKNCGYCEKCIRTKLNFLVNKVEVIESMPTQFSEKDLEQLPRLHDLHLDLFKETLNYAKANKTLSPENQKILENFISKQENDMNLSTAIHYKKNKLLHKIFKITGKR